MSVHANAANLGAPPVLLVHGIWHTGNHLRHMRSHLLSQGIGPVVAVDLRPNTGVALVEDLACAVDAAAAELLASSGAAQLDVVAFSMGALVSRYWLQCMGGKDCTRRFVSISGPHAGTMTAWALPLEGVRQMRPKSPLLKRLEADPDPFGAVEVHTLWTPFDLVVFPPRSACLPAAQSEQSLPVPMHRFMISHPTALSKVTELLRRPG